MNGLKNKSTTMWIVLIGVGLALLSWAFFAIAPDNDSKKDSTPIGESTLSTLAISGKVAFDATCAKCHGVNGSGTKQGPPLIHDIYNPGHHPDAAFYSAVRQGVRQHHWPFGDMPPQPQVTEEQVTAIIGYIREVQKANGIVYREHRM